MKHRTGHLFKRGKAFYVSWRQNGKTATKALRDAEGQPITTRREAQEARAKWMAQFALASDVEALEVLNSRLAGRKADLARLEDAQNPPLHLDRTWAAYVASPIDLIQVRTLWRSMRGSSVSSSPGWRQITRT